MYNKAGELVDKFGRNTTTALNLTLKQTKNSWFSTRNSSWSRHFEKTKTKPPRARYLVNRITSFIRPAWQIFFKSFPV